MTVHIQGSASQHAWGLGGWVANLPLRWYQTNAHNRRNGGNIYNVTNCGISIVISGTEILVYMKALTSHFKSTYEKKRPDTFE